ncbi:hypothetical protein DCO58_11505 [Helicobacter saguini]|uniref:Uncharacterized protein n=1 Tax=Helicobacter saguini TaxID=1548018 RepID=A0A347VQ45_9HELI|nr:hypothetical protein [Helicobacter saguini]MWV61085.1 hypothetical protein [Helicobacter saguini]MWV68246.1 hypothetical protein [Helicobacter saguini]MWV70290.1 hypothetical protein [Helicobacter saguini]MWV72192.1 hypothetical protein [Helicobacter saguini]TLD95246.1 hypothetical protein LS64_002475 [Helicobacter saguini]
MKKILKSIILLSFIAINFLTLNAESEKKSNFKKAYNYIYKTLQRLYIDEDSLNLTPKCDITWQENFCKGDFMCYSTKCAYNTQTKDLYALALVTHLDSLQDSNDKELKEVMPRVKEMIEFGLPTDNFKHDFSFTNSNNTLCKYYVWQKDIKELELNISGCNENIDVVYTFIEERQNSDALGFYKKILKEHIAFLESKKPRNSALINRIKELINFGLPKDYKKHDFSFKDSNNAVCKYYVWRKNKTTLEVNLTGCQKGVDILYTFNNDEKNLNGTIEIYSILDSKVN